MKTQKDQLTKRQIQRIENSKIQHQNKIKTNSK